MNDYGRNRLPFPYSYVLREVFPNQITPIPPEQATRNDCNLVILELTDDTLFKLTSALQAGLDLIYPNEWQTLMDWWSYAYQLANTGEYLTCDGSEIVSICQIVADCINTPGGPANIAVTNLINEALEGITTTGGNVDPLANTENLDCVWGATFDTYELVLDGWATVKVLIDAATDLFEVIQEFTNLFGPLSNAQIEYVETLLEVGTNAIDAYLQQQVTQDEWTCAVFNSIRSRGTPFDIRPTDLDAGWNYLNTFGGFPTGVGDIINTFTWNPTLLSFWRRRIDESCSNDWIGICSNGCGSVLPSITLWTDQRVNSLVPAGIVSGDGRSVNFPAGTTEVQIVLNNAYCWGEFDMTLLRGATQSVPSTFEFFTPDGFTGNEGSGGFGNGNLNINIQNNISQTLTIRVTNTGSIPAWGLRFETAGNEIVISDVVAQ